MKSLFLSLLLIGFGLGLVALSLGGNGGVWSLETGFWSAVAVAAASMRSYARAVRSSLEAGAVPADRDVIAKLEDPYDLDEDEGTPCEERSVSEILREEKRRLRSARPGLGETVRNAVPSFSLLRLGAYGVLVAGFFLLRGSGYLRIFPYLVGLGAGLFAVSALLMARERRHEG